MNPDESSIKFSVIIPVYNAEDFLRECLDSVVNQVDVNTEIIVIDDGSTDDSLAIANSYSQIKVFSIKNSGACVARNYGLSKASGHYIKFLDADDFLPVDSLKKCLDVIHEYPDAVIYCDARKFDSSGFGSVVSIELVQVEDLALQLLTKNILTSTVVYPRSLLEEIGGFNENFLKAQEYHLNFHLALRGAKFVRIPYVCAFIRQHNSIHRISNKRDDLTIYDNKVVRLEEYIRLVVIYRGFSIPRSYFEVFFDSICFDLFLTFKKFKYSRSLQFFRLLLTLADKSEVSRLALMALIFMHAIILLRS